MNHAHHAYPKDDGRPSHRRALPPVAPPVGHHRHSLPRPRPERASEATDAPASPMAVAWRTALFALPLTVAFALLLLLICATVAMRCQDPDAWVTPLGWGAIGLTAPVGGFIAARRGRSASVLCGLLLGGLLCGLLLALSFLPGGAADAITPPLSTAASLALHALLPFASALGALLGRRR